MSDLFLAVGLLSVGIGLFVWLRQWSRRRRVHLSPVTWQWLNDHDYRKDGDDRHVK